MKFRYIFIPVAVICVLMFFGLPRLASSRHRAIAAPNQPAVRLSTNQNPAANVKAQIAAILPTAVQTAAPIPTLAPTLIPVQPQPPAAQPTVPVQQANRASVPKVEAIPVAPTPPPDQLATNIAVPVTANVPEKAAFIQSVTNGQSATITGAYVPNLFGLPVIQQPPGEDNFVSTQDQTLTQYANPAAYGTTALLAHNTLSGSIFFKMQPGQDVIVVFGDGRQVRYQVTDIERYQALSPNDPSSDFVDLNKPGGRLLHHEQLFNHVYTVPNQLVFQTCFTANGDPSWGRLFVIAKPAA
jgi:hypothetical protein